MSTYFLHFSLSDAVFSRLLCFCFYYVLKWFTYSPQTARGERIPQTTTPTRPEERHEPEHMLWRSLDRHNPHPLARLQKASRVGKAKGKQPPSDYKKPRANPFAWWLFSRPRRGDYKKPRATPFASAGLLGRDPPRQRSGAPARQCEDGDTPARFSAGVRTLGKTRQARGSEQGEF